MRFNLDGLDVFFPYEYIYPEQFKYMTELKRALDVGAKGEKGHCLLEMPTGTGKTISLLSLITSYQYAYPQTGKLIYCTRTVPEMTKCMAELKILIDYRSKQVGEDCKILGLCLSSRKNMCIHPKVIDQSDTEAVDAQCRKMTASWVRSKASADVEGDHEEETSIETCGFYENYEKNTSDAVLPPGIYDLDDLKEVGKEENYCPYFLARHILTCANVVVYNYQYMLGMVRVKSTQPVCAHGVSRTRVSSISTPHAVYV
jgi:DNA excision repair protein ERCC-2